MKGKVQAHHIIEKRHLARWGYSEAEIANAPSQILTKQEHQTLTNALRGKLPYGKESTREEVMEIYREVYQDYSGYLEVIEKFLGK